MKPQKMCVIKQGKAIGSDEHKGFADTFNWLVRFCKNLRGDGLFIEVDNKFGDIPTITFKPSVPIGGGGGGPTYKPYPAPFDFDATNNKIIHCVWYMGREYRGLADYAIDKNTSKTYWLKIETDTYGQFSQASIISNAYTLPSGAAVPAIPTNTDQYTHYPLWSIEVSNGTITPTFDWRQTWKTPFYSD